MDKFIEMLIASGYPVIEPILDSNIEEQASTAGTKLGNAVGETTNPWDDEGVEKLAKAARAFADAADAALAAHRGSTE